MATQNPGIARGVLNRLRCSVVLPNFSSLNIRAPNMSRSMARVRFNGRIVVQIPTATGLVNSPEPYVQVDVVIGLLRTQALANAWWEQIQANSHVQDATIYPDTSAYAPMALQDVVVSTMDPGPFDGTSPEFQITLSGALPVNNNLWSY